MKPTEAIEKLNDLRSAALCAKLRYVALGALYEELSKQLNNGAPLLEVGEKAAAGLAADEEDSDSEASESFAAPLDDAPYGRKTDGSPKKRPGKKAREVAVPTETNDVRRASPTSNTVVDSAGATIVEIVPPATPKAHVAPLTSPLTPELREKLARHLGAAPMTCEAIARMSWAVGLDAAKIEALLCEAPDTFIRWQRPDSRDPRLGEDVWGLPHQFDSAVSKLDLQGAKSDRPKSTVVALGCSEPAAIAAWKRIGSEKAS